MHASSSGAVKRRWREELAAASAEESASSSDDADADATAALARWCREQRRAGRADAGATLQARSAIAAVFVGARRLKRRPRLPAPRAPSAARARGGGRRAAPRRARGARLAARAPRRARADDLARRCGGAAARRAAGGAGRHRGPRRRSAPRARTPGRRVARRARSAAARTRTRRSLRCAPPPLPGELWALPRARPASASPTSLQTIPPVAARRADAAPGAARRSLYARASTTQS